MGSNSLRSATSTLLAQTPINTMCRVWLRSGCLVLLELDLSLGPGLERGQVLAPILAWGLPVMVMYPWGWRHLPQEQLSA